MDNQQLSFAFDMMFVPVSASTLSAFISEYVVEPHDDKDVFSVDPIAKGCSCFLYGQKVFEISDGKFRLPGNIVTALFPDKKNLDDSKLYTVAELTVEQMPIFADLLKERKKQNFRKIITCTFACCNSHVACSDAGHCLYEHNRDYNGCYYRTNLENGRIFYGKNKTI